MSDTASEIARLRAALAASEARAEAAESELAQTRAVVSTSEVMIKHLKLEIARLRREHYGRGSERRARLIDQMELQLEELVAAATEDEISATRLAKTTTVEGFERRRPARKPFPEHLPRERVVIAAPTACSCCGSVRIVKMGEDVTETLEVIPRQWKVIQTVREKFTCRSCEKISQPPAPFHPTPRGWAGPNLLAMILFEKFGQHQPLNRQAERYAKEGVEISLSTLADQVGACAAALEPIHAVIRAHVLDAERLHGDDTTVPLLAKGGTRTARLWTYVRDDRPFGGGAPPAALFHFSRDRAMANPNRHLAGWQGLLQADAYGGYNDLYRADRNPGPVRSTLCWSHARRKFFELADIEGNARKGKSVHDISPVALEAVARIDAIFDIERGINGLAAVERQEARRQLSRPLVEALHEWLIAERDRMSKHNPVAKAIGYMFKAERWPAFTRFLDDGRVCLTNNAAERALRGVALGRKSWLFAGSERGGDRAAFMYSLIVTAKMNDVDPQAWLADVLARLPDTTASRVPDLLPWNWSRPPSKDGRMTLIARLRIILNDIDPQPMRQIEVPLKIRLDRLHEVIQAAMGWTDTHLYEFRVGEAGWGVPDPDGFYDGPMPAKKATLEKVLEDTGARTIQYVYDFGDDWDHSIRIERINEATPGMTYPRLLKATGACPPEDVGGAGGYEEFLETIADPDHEKHEDRVRWSGGSFDPEDARIERIVERFDQLAKKWAPRPSKPKASKPTT